MDDILVKLSKANERFETALNLLHDLIPESAKKQFAHVYGELSICSFDIQLIEKHLAQWARAKGMSL